MQAQAIIISRIADWQRRKSFEERSHLLGSDISIKYLSAVEPAAGFKTLTAGEYGCYLSHIAAMESCVPNVPLLVFEDDALVSAKFASVVRQTIEAVSYSGLDLLFLSNTPNFLDVTYNRRLLQLLSLDNLQTISYKFLNAVQAYNWGTVCYYINASSVLLVRSALQHALKDNIASPIDLTFAKLIKSSVLKASIIFPFLVGTDTSLPNTINDRGDEELRHIHNAMANLFVPRADEFFESKLRARCYHEYIRILSSYISVTE
jgi:GR25 family glycosyltransferase involved in LPS biosynthesis